MGPPYRRLLELAEAIAVAGDREAVRRLLESLEAGELTLEQLIAGIRKLERKQ